MYLFLLFVKKCTKFRKIIIFLIILIELWKVLRGLGLVVGKGRGGQLTRLLITRGLGISFLYFCSFHKNPQPCASVCPIHGKGAVCKAWVVGFLKQAVDSRAHSPQSQAHGKGVKGAVSEWRWCCEDVWYITFSYSYNIIIQLKKENLK